MSPFFYFRCRKTGIINASGSIQIQSMKYAYIILLLILLTTSACERVKCNDPDLRFHIVKVDSNKTRLPYELKRYRKASGFTELLESRTDSALSDSYIYIKTNDDYVLSLPTKGVEYKISNILREELKGVRHPFQTGGGSCSVTKCYNYLSYTINGTDKKTGGTKGCYDHYAVAETEVN